MVSSGFLSTTSVSRRGDSSTMLFYLLSLTIMSNIAVVEVAAWMGGSVMSPPNKPSLKMPPLLPTSSFTSRYSSTSHHRRQRNRRLESSSSMTMYFDDISRFTQGHWDPFSLYSSSSSSPRKPFGQHYNEEKRQALMSLLGYTTAESTNHLSKIESKFCDSKWSLCVDRCIS